MVADILGPMQEAGRVWLMRRKPLSPLMLFDNAFDLENI